MAMAPHLLNGIVYCLGNGLFFARQEDIDKPRVFWYSIKRPLGPCWCGAMAAQLICNQWVAGSTPVTSSKKSLRNVDFWAAFAFVLLLSAQKSKNSAKDVDKLPSGW